MKTIILILVLSTACLAQNKLFKEFGNIKANLEAKNFMKQLSKDQPILDNLADSKITQRPFSLNQVVNLSEFSFENHPKPSKKFNFSKYETNALGMRKMTESLVSSLSKQNLLFPEIKKLSSGNKIINQGLLQSLFND